MAFAVATHPLERGVFNETPSHLTIQWLMNTIIMNINLY